ncbi:MAG: hypothetical protein LBJ61_01670 [Deltaproteobacteria bacterium]|jgi:hypothetical protein|nr:hypothetical protein [Deltaproteobacteria bacterium]
MTAVQAEALVQTEIFTDQIDRVDLLVGIVSNINTGNVEIPLVKAHEGLGLTYPNLSSAIAFCDSSQKPELKETFLGTPCPVPRIYQATEPGHPRKINSLFNLMRLAQRLRPKAIIALDGDLPSVKRTWIGRLAQPILCGSADYTSPFYHSLKYDTPVTNIFGYPLFRTLFGRRLRQPFHTDRAFSLELNEFFLSNENWPTDLPYASVEMTLSILAIMNKAKICQSFMATPRLSWQNRALDLTTGRAFRQIAKSLFALADTFQDVWQNCKRSKPTAITGTELSPPVIAPRQIAPPEVFLAEIETIVTKHGALWHQVFAGRKDWVYQKITNESADSINITAEDWAIILFRSLVAYRELDAASQEAFLEALTAVFYGRLLTWLQSGYGLSVPQMESLTEEECVIFESKRPILFDGWNRPLNSVTA